jgi:glycosyltransferase involved in cell wall biosynthesis
MAETHLIFEGWRFVPHSSAVVHQFHCLEATRRPEIKLSLRDRPFNGHWGQVGGMLPQAYEATLQGIPLAPEEEAAAAVIRIDYPCDPTPAPGAGRTLVMAAPGAGSTTSVALRGERGLVEAAEEVEILTPSEFARQGLLRLGVPAERVHVVPRGIDPGFLRPAAAPERDGLRERFGWKDEFVFLAVGAMSDNKGIDLLLHAFAAVLTQHPEARLVLKGIDSIYRSKDLLTGLLRRVPAEVKAAVEPRMTYIGGNYTFVDMTRLYQCADVLVAPYYAEAFCLPVLEAAACGLPSICTAGGPTDEFTTEDFARRINASFDAASGTLRPDVDHLAQLMAGAIGDATWRQRAGGVAPQYVGQLHTWRHSFERLLRVLGL